MYFGSLKFRTPGLFSDDFDQNSFGASAVEFAVENLFPRAEVETSFGYGDDDFSAHDLPLVMGVAVILAGPVVMIRFRRRIERRESFKPMLIILDQSPLIVIDKHARRDVHRVYQAEPFLDTAFCQGGFDVRRDILKTHPLGDVEREIFGV